MANCFKTRVKHGVFVKQEAPKCVTLMLTDIYLHDRRNHESTRLPAAANRRGNTYD